MRHATAACVLLIPAIPVAVSVWKADPEPGLYAKAELLRGVTVGIDPRKIKIASGAPSNSCAVAQVDLSNPDHYGYETNMWKPVARDAKIVTYTFDSDQSPGKIWTVPGPTSAASISVGFTRKENDDADGAIQVKKEQDEPYAKGWQIATECVGKVQTVCPYVLGPADTISMDVLKAAHLKQGCKILPLGTQITVTDNRGRVQ